jgi:hypothetical protein
MTTRTRNGHAGKAIGLLSVTGLLGLLAAPLAASAAPYPYAIPARPAAYGGGTSNGYRSDYDTSRYGGQPVDPAYIQAQTAQRCNVGRLVGGLLGGGIGYAVSQGDGRTWAVPLGALLGQQMGCSVGAGGPPRPW